MADSVALRIIPNDVPVSIRNQPAHTAQDLSLQHELTAVPKTGASRPPAGDRLRLYGLYKQAMEGDVDGVMERPSAATLGSGVNSDELQREKDKWDAWNAQRGLTRTDAKKRYIEALIETMHRYATTPSTELQTFAKPTTGTEGPMKVLSPMSEDDAAEQEYREQHPEKEEGDGEGEGDGEYVKKGDKWSRKVERALVRLSAEVAALREQITAGREWRTKKEKTLRARISWLGWLILKHVIADSVILCIVLLWMRRRKDRRLEDLVRSALKLAREYARNVLPSR
ncbi:acyl CoA binding protein-domain-containing protein [Apiospora sp. TS-2023a]